MSRRQAGFTLLEMLVALLVFGLVMAGIAQSFRFGLVAWRAGARAAQQPDQLAAADAALTRLIAQAMPGSMTGRADGLAFTTTLPAGAGLHGALADVAITAGPDGVFKLRYRPHPPGVLLVPEAAAQTEPLAPGVTRLAVAYLTVSHGAPSWSRKWSGQGLPLLVRLHLDLANGRTWPDLVAAPVDHGG